VETRAIWLAIVLIASVVPAGATTMLLVVLLLLVVSIAEMLLTVNTR
jgi:hypothetical protein